MKAINWKWPLSFDGNYGPFESNQKVEDAILEDIRLLVNTRKGERVCQPDYGCDIPNQLFEPMDNGAKIKIRAEIINQVMKYVSLVSHIDVKIYYPNEVTIGTPLYGQIVFPDNNGMFILLIIDIQNPAKTFVVKKTFGIMITPSGVIV